jgi:hypothetical protein
MPGQKAEIYSDFRWEGISPKPPLSPPIAKDYRQTIEQKQAQQGAASPNTSRRLDQQIRPSEPLNRKELHKRAPNNLNLDTLQRHRDTQRRPQQ